MGLKAVVGAADRRRRRWTGAADNRKIFAAALVVGFLTLGAKIAGMGRELLAAGSFGTGDAFDAYVVAWELPAFVINVIAGSFSGALVPVYVRTRDREGTDAARRLLAGVLVVSFGLLCGTTAILAVAAPSLLPLVASGFDGEKLALTQRLFYILLPSILLSGLATLLTGVLDAAERFALGAASAVAVPACSIAALLGGRAAWGIDALAVGLVAGFAVQLLLLAWALKRTGVSPAGGWHARAPVVRQVVGQYLPLAAGMLLICSTPLVDQAMAASLGGGNAAVFSYGGRIVAVILSVGTTALGTAVLPYFSRMVALRDWTAIRGTLRVYSALILLVTIPVTGLLFALSETLVGVLYERGAFTAADTEVVGRVQAMLALQIPFYSLGMLYVRLISSLRANHLLMYGTVISFVLNISLDYVLKERLGVAGIALATVIVYVVSLAYLATMLSRLLAKETEG